MSNLEGYTTYLTDDPANYGQIMWSRELDETMRVYARGFFRFSRENEAKDALLFVELNSEMGHKWRDLLANIRGNERTKHVLVILSSELFDRSPLDVAFVMQLLKAGEPSTYPSEG